MKTQAEISLYPLRQNDLSEPIRQFCHLLEENNLEVRTGTMSSIVTGESESIFKGLQKAFESLTERTEVVLTIKISNACPQDE